MRPTGMPRAAESSARNQKVEFVHAALMAAANLETRFTCTVVDALEGGGVTPGSSAPGSPRSVRKVVPLERSAGTASHRNPQWLRDRPPYVTSLRPPWRSSLGDITQSLKQ
jgi:hypothetical protein